MGLGMRLNITGTVRSGRQKKYIKKVTAPFFSYPLHFAGIVGESVGECSCVVSDVVKPANILMKHRLEQQIPHTRRQTLTRYCERKILNN